MRVALTLLVTMAAACGTPYQRNGFFSFRGGFSDRDLGNGRYSIDVQVSGYTSAGTALDYAHRRAGELCPGGYDVVDGSKSSNPYVYATKDFVTAGNKPEVALSSNARGRPRRPSSHLRSPATSRARPLLARSSLIRGRSTARRWKRICRWGCARVTSRSATR